MTTWPHVKVPTDLGGMKISGFLSEDLSEEEIINFDKAFLNKICIAHIEKHITKFKKGDEKITYELLGIRGKN